MPNLEKLKEVIVVKGHCGTSKTSSANTGCNHSIHP